MIIAWKKKYKDVFWSAIEPILPLKSLEGSIYLELLKLYKTLIRPAVSYGAEAWTLKKKEEQALLIFGRKIFRRIYGPKYDNGEWKSRTNRELEDMSKRENIV
jgi:hypothetical protein